MKTNKRNSDAVSRAVARAFRLLKDRRAPGRGVGTALLALAALSLQGCESQPTAPAGQESKSKLAGGQGGPGAQAQTQPRATPQRLQAGKPPVAAGSAAAAASAPVAKDDGTSGLMNPGDEVDGNVGAERVPSRVRARAEASGSAPSQAAAERVPGSRAAQRAAAPDDAKPTWSVLLATFSGEDARANAMGARDQIARRYPMLKDAFVRPTTRGSVVLYGRFEGTRDKDPAAKAALDMVHGIQQDGQRVFGRAMLTRVGAAPDNAPPGPHDLRTVRAQAPRAVLYSLQVAAWIGSDMKEQEMPMREVKRAAEAYCAQLRAQGNEAYYFHDYDTLTSVVTVGVFGKDAYDSRSTLYSPEVESVARKFPKSLVNGEEVLIPVDPKNPKGKTIPQAPRLVEVPKA